MSKKTIAATLFSSLLLACLSIIPISVQADEASVKKAVEAKLGISVDSITRSGYLGLYEIYASGSILYTDEKLSVLINGELIDTKTMQNITAARMEKLNRVEVGQLPLNQAIKLIRGNGKRMLITFEDPNCGYCKRLAKDLANLDNVTIYTFIIPILAPDSATKAKQIWCSPDKEKAWTDYMIDGKPLIGKSDCENPIDKNLVLARKFKLSSVPALIFADGSRVSGALPAEAIEKRLKDAENK